MTSDLVFVGCGLLAGIITLWWGLETLRTGRASLEWPSVRGELIAGRVRARSADGHRFYEVSVTYQYQVGGRVYQASRVALLSQQTRERTEAEAALEHMRSLPWLYVYYDPARPERALLQPGTSEAVPVAAIAGGACAIAVCGWILMKPYL